MRFTSLPLKGACLIDLDLKRDVRGFFARVWCDRTFQARGLEGEFVQSSISFTEKRGTIRGLHYQHPPFEEAKLVRCARGAIFDVLVDVREDAATYGKWHAEILRGDEYRLLYVAPGIAHGFQTLVDDTEVHYWMSSYHDPEAEAGVRFDDPAVAIEWPLQAVRVSSRDLELPRLKEKLHS
jgi:dTDP-4-dehydrorhamnose 3,5-epimerase